MAHLLYINCVVFLSGFIFLRNMASMPWVILLFAGYSLATVDYDSAELVARIIDKYYVQRQVPLLIQSEPRARIVDHVIGQLQFSRAIQFDSFIIGHQSWHYVLSFIEKYADLQDNEILYSSELFNPFGYYIVVFQHIAEAEIKSAFETFWNLQITRVVIVVTNEDQPRLYNYSPYDRNKCGTPNINRINISESSQLFQAMFNDFHNCPLKMGTFESPPFIHIAQPPDNGQPAVDGFEGDLINTIARKFHFSLQIMLPPDGAQWGIARRNGSTGLMKILQDEMVHFGIGCLGLIADRNEILAPGRPHYASRVLFVVPDGRPYTAVEKLFRPFNCNVWIAVAVTIGLAGLTVLVLQFTSITIREFIYGENNRSAFFNTIGVFFTGSVERAPKRNFARTLLFLWIMHCFVIRSLYQGLLFKYLRGEATHKAVETLEEIEQSDLHYHMLKISERFFQGNSRVLGRVRTIQPGNDSLNVAMDAVATKQLLDGVVMVSSEHVAFHNKHRIDKGFIRSTRDNIATLPIVIYYPKRSFLVPEFNRVIGQIQMAGLMSYWVQRYGNYDFFPRKESKEQQPVPMDVRQLTGCYEACAVLWVLSFVVFLLECWSRKLRLLRIVLEFLAKQ
ncbi:uncharacterized protein LOC131676215 [Topomyia yanbarensis]|uniref:uncharacterized protein LOC131676215 n=1 Tax=Topomyia yanbarensis TaxID=2498891 RepID=UPI00273ABBEB|nr:uncharacterized protein LOC131676215 [Topomyia yanbarensis]